MHERLMHTLETNEIRRIANRALNSNFQRCLVGRQQENLLRRMQTIYKFIWDALVHTALVGLVELRALGKLHWQIQLENGNFEYPSARESH